MHSYAILMEFSVARARPVQSRLTEGNDLTKTEASLEAVAQMVDGLNDHDIDGMGRFFHEGFVWRGNAGCGIKHGLREFQNNWQRPFQAAFSEKVCIDEVRIAQGEWVAAFGYQSAIHSGEFMGIAPTGKLVEIRYMDFWHVREGRIDNNWVMVDFVGVMQQLGVDPLEGHGWEKFDRQGQTPVEKA
ncbi:MAG: hypothetical protein RLY30_413 [Pseudomonadota bacterium]